MLEQRRNSEVISELLNLQGKRVLDVGSGDGALARLLTRKGAKVTGIECNPRQLTKAKATEKAGDEHYLDGRGEALPVDDESADIVIFFNSLHHVPVEGQDQALIEASRVLIPNGQLYISEPIASGAYFEMMKPFDDETFVRAEALNAINRATETLFDQVREVTYFYPDIIANYETLAEEATRIDSARDELFRTRDLELRQAFDMYGVRQPDGRFAFDQPMRVNLLCKKRAVTGMASATIPKR